MQRSFWYAALASVALASCVLCTQTNAPAAGDAARSLRAGAFAIDITPTRFPVSSNGSMTDRQATAAHDPLHARCLVLDDGTARIAIVVVDACMIPRELVDEAKQLAANKTEIPVEQITISATHTHSAVTLAGCFQSEAEEEYCRFLVERIAAGIEQAARQLEPARVGWGAGSDPSQVFNRRWFLKSGMPAKNPFGKDIDQVRMNPPQGSDALDRPAGPTDPEIGLLSVQSRDGRPIVLLANYSLHYVGGVPAEALSADYFAAFADRMAQHLGATKTQPAFVGIMSNGTSGNVNNINFTQKSPPRRDPFEQIQIVAASVAEASLKTYREIKYHDWVPVAVREKEIELGVRLPTEAEVEQARAILAAAGPGPYAKLEQIYARETVLMADYPKTVRAKLQAIRIGGLGIATSPCETFVETGLAIKQHSPMDQTFTIELANGYNGYLPTSEHHQLGGYETWRARSSYLAPDSEARIRATLLELLHEAASVSR